MPLDNSLWAKGKCGYKILQYMGVGIPVVASPVGINSEFIMQGENGYLADTIEEWVKYLELLIKDSVKREKMELKGRKIVESQYCVKKYSEKYSKIIKGILNNSETV